MREAIFGSLLLVCFAVRLASASVVLKPFFFVFNDIPAKFAVGVNSSGSCGALHLADPLDACSSLLNKNLSHNRTARFALIVRGQCSFDDKVRNAQNAGFRAAIVYDDREKGSLIYMMVNPEGVSAHAVFVSRTSGEILKEHARGGEAECCIYPSHQETAWTVFAISSISLVVVLAIIAPFFTPRHWLFGRGANRQSQTIDTKMVEALPCFSFSPSHLRDCHMGETCAICLEDYKDGETLKVLPCQHGFHSSCVDSWLTKWGTSCPVCKHDLRTKIPYAEIKRAS